MRPNLSFWGQKNDFFLVTGPVPFTTPNYPRRQRHITLLTEILNTPLRSTASLACKSNNACMRYTKDTQYNRAVATAGIVLPGGEEMFAAAIHSDEVI